MEPLLTEHKSLDEIQKQVTGTENKQEKIDKPEQTPEFAAAVGISRKWDARDAGIEVAKDVLSKLNGKKPNFVLLISTIHYADHGGFKSLLKGIYEVLPKEVQLVGCTYAGFMVPQGVFTRGCCLMGVSATNIDFAAGIAHNTKRSPIMAGKQCAKQIRRRLSRSTYRNKFVFFFPAAATTPQFPVIGSKRVIRLGNKHLNNFFSLGVSWINDFLRVLIQKGMGMEEDVLNSFVSELPDFMLIGGASMDDNKMASNYQFYNDKVYNNTVVALAITTNLEGSLETTYGLKKVAGAIDCKVTKRRSGGYTIHKLNGKSPAEQYLKMTGGDESWFDNRIHRRTFFLPMGYTVDNTLYPQVVAYVMGDDILCGYRVRGDNLSLYTLSGTRMIKSIKDNLEKTKQQDKKMVFISSCAARLETLGVNVYETKKEIEKYMGSTPYLLVYTGGEQTYVPGGKPNFFYETFNTLVLCSPKNEGL